jgi:penicillin-binding protein 1B
MPRKRRRRKSRNTAGAISIRAVPIAWVLQFAVILVLICAGYIIWLDHRITTEFEGKRWSLPARVYSSPFELYVGQPLAQGKLERELHALHYKEVPLLARHGQYHREGDVLSIYLRPFYYWDGQSPATPIRVEFSDGHISSMQNIDTGSVLAVSRLEPRLIGKIYPEHNEDRVLVRYSEVPPFLVNALIAVEDRQFYQHGGIDMRGIARAFLANIRSGELTQGGSTLTQQLVKNFFLTHERTFTRKVNEVLMALLLERRYSKTEILSAYINEVYLGQNGSLGIHGFGTAAEFYFGKPLNELAPEQLALLVGLVRGASFYNPWRHPDRALARRNLVLELTAQQGYISADTARRLELRPLDLGNGQQWSLTPYPAFLQLVRRELLQNYRMEDLRNEGLRIFTTLDPVRQLDIEQAVRRRLSQLEAQHGLHQGLLETAAMVVDISNGEIVAVMGGRKEEVTGFNRVLQAQRPIGSLIKPFIYLTALSDAGNYNLLSELNDTAISLQQPDGDDWQPQNYEKQAHGQVTLLEALTRSYNLATVRLGLKLGLDKVIGTLHAAGVEGDIKPYPSLLLGALELSPFEVAQIYQTLANGGYRVPLKAIRDVLDKDGKPLQRVELEVQPSLPPAADFLTEYLMTQVVDIGTARQLRNVFPQDLRLAGKTGTTNDSRDSWFVGFDDRFLTVTWLGRDDYKPTPFTGATGAMQLWSAIEQSGHPRTLNLVPSDLIQWTHALGIRFEDECLRLDALPYIKGHPPDAAMVCDSGTSWLSPLKWFQ